MATVDVHIIYTIKVPELDEVETEGECDEIMQDIYDDWTYYIDRDGYEACCAGVNY